MSFVRLLVFFVTYSLPAFCANRVKVAKNVTGINIHVSGRTSGVFFEKWIRLSAPFLSSQIFVGLCNRCSRSSQFEGRGSCICICICIWQVQQVAVQWSSNLMGRAGVFVFVLVFIFVFDNMWALLIWWTGQVYLYLYLYFYFYLFLYLYLTTGGLFQFDGRGSCPVGVTLADVTWSICRADCLSCLAWELFFLSFFFL